MRLFFVLLLIGVCSWADVRYLLRCEVESSDKMMSKSGALQAAMKDCTSEILQTKEKQLSRNGKVSQILDFKTETTITLDHEKKTWSKGTASVGEKAAQAQMEQLKSMGAQFKMVSNPITETKKIAGYEAKGLAGLLQMTFNFPGMDKGMSSRAVMEFWVSETAPGAAEVLQATSGQQSPTLRLMAQFLTTVPGGSQMLKDGANLRGQLMEMTMKMETAGLADTLSLAMLMRAENFVVGPIEASEFEVPADYKEVK